MIKIKNKNIDETWEYEGLKVIQTKYPDNLNNQIRDSMNKGELIVQIDDKLCNYNRILNINQYTKTKDLHNFTKNNSLIDELSKIIDYDNLINVTNICERISKFNNEVNSNFLSLKLDKTKILSAIFDIDGDSFMNENELNLFLENNKNTNDKKLIVLCNIKWITMNKILKYLNYYYFLIITSDFTSFFKNYKNDNLDGILVINNDNKFTDLIDFCKLSEYLTQKTGNPISEEELIRGICLDKNDEKIEKFCDLIKKI